MICFSAPARLCFGSKVGWLFDFYQQRRHHHFFPVKYTQSFSKQAIKCIFKLYTHIYMVLCQYSRTRIPAEAEKQKLGDFFSNIN